MFVGLVLGVAAGVAGMLCVSSFAHGEFIMGVAGLWVAVAYAIASVDYIKNLLP